MLDTSIRIITDLLSLLHYDYYYADKYSSKLMHLILYLMDDWKEFESCKLLIIG